jgi:hypothetical protein
MSQPLYPVYPASPVYPVYPSTLSPPFVIQPIFYPNTPTKEDFDSIKKELQEIKELIKNIK